ncbi:PD-(D/E)XK nuclease family protein [Agromyces sp. MMS24-JH15]|uniref:PD-(D/E)XK nuclease family protein n=1 Tax=Agromyces sp. MMS24-JH15 TaxID=3243765 RepID=UPI00374A93E1
MTATARSLNQLATALVPLLSRSLAEQFNVFRVMHHGTHEKQLSNVFAWLLRVDGTHGFGDAFQRLFVEHVNRGLSSGAQLPTSGYRVVQEVDTSGPDALGKDVADIVLASPRASIVVENFEASDGHGHDYQRYLAFGAAGSKQSVVVLLCARHEAHRQTDGWEHAVVVTYTELLEGLQAHIARDAAWQRTHPEQLFFVNQLVDHFVEGAGAVSNEDRIAFIRTMCETGESARYGYRPQEVAAQEFADLLAQHAKRQFEEGRATLAQIKRSLRSFAEQTVAAQVNNALRRGQIESVQARWVGKWEWCITLRRTDSEPLVLLEFGPTAVVFNGLAPEPLVDPDYSKVFVSRQVGADESVDRIVQTDVGLDEILAGLPSDDTRLADTVLAVISAS